MSTVPSEPNLAQAPAPAVKPPWRFAEERRLGRLARQLVGFAEPEIPCALDVLGRDPVLTVTREPGWALACLGRAADCDEGSAEQGAWVLLAASRPTLVRRAILGPPPARRSRRAASRRGTRPDAPRVG